MTFIFNYNCKSFGLHQPIRTCHIRLLLKFIVKSIHLNTPNNISKKKLFHVFPKISIPPQLLRLQPQSLLDLRLPPHYLTKPPSAAALPHRTTH